ncbi:MAG: hypothetical protein LJE59_00730 [Chromatiaceae bacterium]|nr:hypothetical protein [Chromatiaceae bacterium]
MPARAALGVVETGAANGLEKRHADRPNQQRSGERFADRGYRRWPADTACRPIKNRFQGHRAAIEFLSTERLFHEFEALIARPVV